MKILGLIRSSTENSINTKLIEFTLSLFDQIKTEMLDIDTMTSVINYTYKKSFPDTPSSDFEQIYKSANLVVISISNDGTTINESFNKIFNLISSVSNTIEKKPILLIRTYKNSSPFTTKPDVVTTQFSSIGCEVWETFYLPDFENNFEDGFGVSNISLRIELTKIINHIQFSRLKIKDNNYTTCGIDRSRNECGDASDY